MLLKHRQDGVGGKGNLCVHAAIDSGRVLKDRSGETATTPKIVTDATAGAWPAGSETLRPPRRGPHRES
jgi:hypothetical protein